MSNRPIIEVLGELRFAAGLPPKALAELAGISQFREFSGGSILFREGAECQELFLLATGDVALEMHVPPRGTVRILTVGAGELLGWSALIGNGRMTATAIALDRVSVVAIPGPTLRSLCDADHELGYQVMRQMAAALSRRLLATRLQLLDLFSQEAPAVRVSQQMPPSPQVTSTPVKDHHSP